MMSKQTFQEGAQHERRNQIGQTNSQKTEGRRNREQEIKTLDCPWEIREDIALALHEHIRRIKC